MKMKHLYTAVGLFERRVNALGSSCPVIILGGKEYMALLDRLEQIKKGKDRLNFSWERKSLPKVCDMDDMSYTVVKSLRKGA